ncbi:MAG: YciI family protein [candidate division Zixibacteria bacterium]|nr:YciI family protein [candidate division Zixibacteria bacterium]
MTTRLHTAQRIIFVLALSALAIMGSQRLTLADETGIDNSAATEQPVAKKQFVILIAPTRANFLETMTKEEQTKVSEHFLRLKGLHAEGKIILAGPCDDAAFGLIVVETETEAEAREIAHGDPAVQAGVFVLKEIHPFTVALLRK